MKCIGIVWNCSYKYYKEIRKIILKHGKIISSFDLDLSEYLFPRFILDLYNYDDDNRWKSEYKINDLSIYDNKRIRIFEIEINNEEKIINKKGIEVNKNSQELKDKIRGKYKYIDMENKKGEIYLENSFHLTDNEEEYIYQKKIIKKYYKMSCDFSSN